MQPVLTKQLKNIRCKCRKNIRFFKPSSSYCYALTENSFEVTSQAHLEFGGNVNFGEFPKVCLRSKCQHGRLLKHF